MNLITPDNGEKYIVELSNSTLTNIKGQQAKKPDITLTINRSDLENVMMGATTLNDQVKNGKAKLDGKREGFDAVRNALVWINIGFEILPGTGGTTPTAPTAPKDPFQQPEPALNTMTD